MADTTNTQREPNPTRPPLVQALEVTPTLKPRRNWLGVAMFTPAILYIVAIIGVPFVMAFLYAFSSARVGTENLHFVGFENFRSVLTSPAFQRSIWNSFV